MTTQRQYFVLSVGRDEAMAHFTIYFFAVTAESKLQEQIRIEAGRPVTSMFSNQAVPGGSRRMDFLAPSEIF